MTRRINARLPPELATKLAELQRRTGKSVTDLVQDALEKYYDDAHGATDPRELLVNFVGCANGPRGLSSSYKRDLFRSLERKA